MSANPADLAAGSRTWDTARGFFVDDWKTLSIPRRQSRQFTDEMRRKTAGA